MIRLVFPQLDQFAHVQNCPHPFRSIRLHPGGLRRFRQRAAHLHFGVVGVCCNNHQVVGQMSICGHTDPPIVALAVDDLEAAVERLRVQQIDLPWGIEQDADSRWVMFYDPAGNLIELAQFQLE